MLNHQGLDPIRRSVIESQRIAEEHPAAHHLQPLRSLWEWTKLQIIDNRTDSICCIPATSFAASPPLCALHAPTSISTQANDPRLRR
jgi:hypothetical protein